MCLIDGVEVGFHTVVNVVHDHVVHRAQEKAVVVVAEVPGVLGEALRFSILGRQGPVGRLLEDVFDDGRRVAEREALRRLERGQRAVRRLLGPVVLTAEASGQDCLIVNAVLGSEEADLLAPAHDGQVDELGLGRVALDAGTGTHGCLCCAASAL